MTKHIPIVHVELFSEFKMTINDQVLTADMLRSEMLLKLLVYMFRNHRKSMAITELCEALWHEDESVNPAAALKNLFYRLRTVLDKIFHRKDFFVTQRGAYAWNQELALEIDAEQFESTIREANQCHDVIEKEALLLKGIEMYQGTYMKQLSMELWVIQQSTFYQSLYTNTTKKLAALYESQAYYDKMEYVCMRALKYEELDEGLHCCLLIALLKQDKKKSALDHYKHAKDLLYTQLGTVPSQEMQDIYQELLKDMKQQELDIHVVQGSIKEQLEENSGAFYCEYGVFKEIYAIQARQAKRLGIAVHCAMITIESIYDLPLGSDMYHKFEESTMEILKNIIESTLRTGDIFTRYSATQYMLLLPTCDFEGGETALSRICDSFYKIRTRQLAKLVCSLEQMEL